MKAMLEFDTEVNNGFFFKYFCSYAFTFLYSTRKPLKRSNIFEIILFYIRF